MEKSSKELLFQDLSARLPHHVRVKIWLRDGTTEEGELSLKNNYNDVLRDAFYYNRIIDIKPYLRPLSSMTKEERKEYHFYCYYYYGTYFDTVGSIDWLNKKMFDYRKDDEGKTLIEKGLALEALEGMYETE